MGGQQVQSSLCRDTFLGDDQRHRRHHVGNLAGQIGLKPHVTVGANADQHALVVNHRQTRDTELGTQLVDVTDRVARRTGNGVGDHAGLGTLHYFHVLGLVVDRKVAVKDADATLPGHRNGHPRFCHRIHCCGHQRNTQPDIPCELRRCVHFGRNHIGGGRNKKDIIESKTYKSNFVWVVATCAFHYLSPRTMTKAKCHHALFCHMLPQKFCGTWASLVG